MTIRDWLPNRIFAFAVFYFASNRGFETLGDTVDVLRDVLVDATG